MLFTLQAALDAVKQYLRSGKTLEEFEAEHGIRGKTDGNHIILDYDQITVKWTEPFGYVCRGLVLDAHTFDVLAFGLHKFFNSGEFYADQIDWNTAFVLEKLDGSMVNRWWSPHTNRFEYSTRFQLPADLQRNQCGDFGITWAELINRCIGEATFEQAHDETIALEVMSPINKVVVDHKSYKFAVLARRNNSTFIESDIRTDSCAPRAYAFGSAQDVQAFADTLKGTECEGFVVVDGNFRRVKIKGAAYVKLHHLKDGLNSLKNIILFVRKGETEEVLLHFPEFAVIANVIKGEIERLISEHEIVYNQYKDIKVQKDFALSIQRHTLVNPAWLYQVRAGRHASIHDAAMKMDETSFVKMMKPIMKSKHNLDVSDEAEA